MNRRDSSGPQMTYTSFVDTPRIDLGRYYERLELLVSLAAKNDTGVYVLRIAKGNAPQLKNVQIVRMPDCIDFIVQGTLVKAKRIARKIHEATGKVVGGVRVEEPYLASIIQAEAHYAIEIAKQKKQPFYIKQTAT